MHCAVDFAKSAAEMYEGVASGAWRQDRGVLHFVALCLVNYFGSQWEKVWALQSKKRKGALFKCLVVQALEHCKLKLTINTNQVKCWFLRRG